MRRVFTLFVLVVLAFPVVALAGGPDGDPDGVQALAPIAADWLDVLIQVVFAFPGI